MPQELVINSFKDEWELFSNFSLSVVHYNGLNFQTVEHAFQAAKSNKQSDWNYIQKLKTPGQAKRAGRKVQLRSDWEEVKIIIMRNLLIQKFTLYDKFKNKLISSGNAKIIEGNYWHDNYWGDCYCSKCENIKGYNNLGILLMEIRNSIIGNQFIFKNL